MRLTFLGHAAVRLEIGEIDYDLAAARTGLDLALVPIHDDTFPQIRQGAAVFAPRVASGADACRDVLAPGDALDL